MASKKVAEAYVSLTMQTAAFKAAINEASGEMKKFGAQMREESQKSRESVRLLSEELGLGIPRGLQGIISKLPGVATAMNLAFDSVVVFALIGTVVKVTEKIVEFGKKNEEAAKKHKEAWQEAAKDVSGINSQLEISGSRIQDTIAKLEKKPGNNGLKTALLEASDEADKLGDKLDKDLEKLSNVQVSSGLASLFAGGQSPADKAAATAALRLQGIMGDYRTPMQSASERGDTANYNQLRHDQLNRIAVDPEFNQAFSQLSEYLRANQGLVGQHNQAFDNAANAFRIIAGSVQSLSQLGDKEVGGQKVATLESNKAAESLAKAEAEARKKTFEEHFAADYAHQVPNAAAIMANPGTPGHPGVMAQWEGGKDKAEYTAIVRQLQDAAKNGLKSQDIAMFKVLLLAIGTKLDIQTAVDFQKAAAANQTYIEAQTSFDTKSAEMAGESQKSLEESLSKLTEATDKSRESLIKSIVEYNDAVDKQRLRSGQITESQYQGDHISGMHATLENALADNKIKEQDDLKKLQSEANSRVLAFNLAVGEAIKKEGLGKAEIYIPKDGGESSLTFSRNDSNTDAQDKRVDELFGYLGEQIKSIAGGLNAGGNQIKQAHSNADKADRQNFNTDEFQAKLAAFQSTAMGGIDSVFDEFEARAVNAGKLFHDTLDGALNSVNDAVLKTITARDHRGVWKDAGKSIFTNVAKTGLQTAEGSIMKALGLGTKVQHVHVDNMPDADKLVSGHPGSNSGSLISTATNVASSAASSGGFWSGLFKGIATFAGAMAGGGVMTPGGFYLTGEQGPELLQVGSTSRINNARDTTAILKGGSGGDTHHWNIDARGSNDPAAVRRQVMQGIKDAAPHIIAAGHAAQTAQQRSKPTTQR